MLNKGLRLFCWGSGISFADDEKMKWKGLGCFSSTLCGASWTLSALKDCPCAPAPEEKHSTVITQSRAICSMQVWK